VEASPSYSHFIARLHLDALLLLRANRKPPIPGLAGRVRREYAFLEATASPKGKALQVGDSYALDVARDLEIVGDLFALAPVERARSACFKASGLAVLRSRTAEVYLDAMPGGLWHIHRGKPNVLVWRCGRSVLVDSGGVNYDRVERTRYFAGRAAHNAVVVEPVEKDEAPGRETAYKVTRFRASADGGSVTATCRYTGGGAHYSWRRTVTLAGDRLEVLDCVTAGRPVRATLHWHLAAGRVARSKGGFRARGRGWTLSGQCVRADGRPLAARLARRPAVDGRNRRFVSPDISFSQRGRSLEFRSVLELAD
jgi:hypothetical protein